MARAKACGEKMPEPVPHPDDIVLNYTDREVRFEGPLTLEKANEAKELRDLSHLFYELAAYHGHQYDLDGDTGDLKGSYWIACFFGSPGITSSATARSSRHASRSDAQMRMLTKAPMESVSGKPF